MDFDSSRLYYSHQQLQVNTDDSQAEAPVDLQEEDAINLDAVQRHFREFLRKFWCWSTIRS